MKDKEGRQDYLDIIEFAKERALKDKYSSIAELELHLFSKDN